MSKLWRWIFIVGAVVASVCACLLGYWIHDGQRRLACELEALRASGAPEFPEQIRFSPRPAGDDPAMWWQAIDEACTDYWSNANLPDCASRIAGGEDASGIESKITAALRHPRLLESLSACELSVLRLRVDADRAALELSMQVERFAPYDWDAASRGPKSSTGEIQAIPPIGGYIESIHLLCVQAVLLALDGDFAKARQELGLAARAAQLIQEAPNVVLHGARGKGLDDWINEGVLPLLQLLPSDTDWAEVDALLTVIDLPAEFQVACIGDRAMLNGIYRGLRNDVKFKAPFEPKGWASTFLARTLIARDQAEYLELMRMAIETAGERELTEPWDKLKSVWDHAVESRHALLDVGLWVAIATRLDEGGRYCLGAQTRIRLVRAALIARRGGAAAARAFLEPYRDPFNGEALRTRLDPDGILTMWSVGEDGKDNPPAEQRDKHVPLDDIVVETRTNR